MDKVGTLKAPPEIAAQAERMADLADRQRDVLSELIDAAKDNDLARVRELAATNEAVNDEASKIARDLGAESCADGS